MKNLLKLTLITSAIICMLLAFNTNAYAETVAEGTCGESLTWVLDSEGTLTISGEGPMEDYENTTAPWYEHRNSIVTLVINSKVESIGDYAFYDCENLKTVRKDESLTSVGNYAFKNCINLTCLGCGISDFVGEEAFYNCQSFSFNGLVLSTNNIGNRAYSNCTGITRLFLEFSDGTTLGEGIFSGCTGLIEVSFSNSYSTGDYTFDGCTNLKEVSAVYVDSIGKYAFKNCTALEDINLGYYKYAIDEGAFYNCDGLKSISTPLSPHAEKSYIGKYAFYDCDNLETVYIYTFVTDVGGSAFESCDKLTTVNLCEYIKYIEPKAFYNCPNLTDIYYADDDEAWADVIVGDDNDALTKATMHYTFLNAEDVSGTWGDNLTWHLTQKGVLTISGTGPMYDPVEDEVSMSMPWKGRAITKVIIEDGVTSISTAAFSNVVHDYDDLTEVVIPNTVTHIGSNAFAFCNIERIDIPDSVKTIGSVAFANCTNLAEIKIGANVESIGESAFYGSAELTDIFVDKNNNNYISVDGILFNKEQTELICYPAKKPGDVYVIPERVKSLGAGAFANNSTLKKVVMHDGITVIPGSAFYQCVALEEINIPKTVTHIGSSAFKVCIKLKRVIIPDGVTIIAGSTFDNCHSLEYVDLGNSVTEVRNKAFQTCKALTTMVIPKTLTINEGAFGLTKEIKDVYYNGSEEEWAASELCDDSAFASATIHYNCIFDVTLKCTFNYDEVYNDSDKVLIEVSLEEESGTTRLVVGGEQLYYSQQRDMYVGIVGWAYICDDTVSDVIIAKAAPASFIYGNVDGDNNYEDIDEAVDTSDLQALKLALKGIKPLTGANLVAGDVDGDSLVDGSDLQAMKLYLKTNKQFGILK